LVFPTASLRVLDPKDSSEDRGNVQKTMETEVLRISEYLQVTFEATAVDRPNAANQLRVRGNLTIRGKTQPVIIPVTFAHVDDGSYKAVGEYKFKQTAFGIKPTQRLGGAVTVKDELRVEFELFLK
jgi:polyisoprenoid-binding protein YceI